MAVMGSVEDSSEALRSVTIVVPVYDDLPTLTLCVESLKRNVNLERNCVLFVNDCGPDADMIEASLLAQIENFSSIRYERNERNLGFVGTCNRAVTELDATDNDILLLNSDTATTPGFLEELSRVLHSSPLHGIVCPRSNDAWIASFPHMLRDPSKGHQIARAAEVHSALSGVVRRYSISPVAVGFCLLIRRELIRQNGLFDEVFSPGYFEELDFCLRMNELGYSSIIANRAMVFHYGARSFAATRGSLLSTHSRVLVRRHPFFKRAIRHYWLVDRDPVDVFADALVPADEVRRVLVDLDTGLSDLPDDIRALLAALEEASDPKRLVTSVSIPDSSSARFSLQYPSLGVIRHSGLGQMSQNRLWDVAVASSDTASLTQLIRLNRISPRWVFISTGIRGVREWRLRAGASSPSKLPVQDAIRHADGIVALGTGVKAEIESYTRSVMPPGADNIIELKGIDGHGMVEQIMERYGRSPVRIELLRARWDYFTACDSARGELFIHRFLRRVQYAAPGPIGSPRGLVRKLLRANRIPGVLRRRLLSFKSGG